MIKVSLGPYIASYEKQRVKVPCCLLIKALIQCKGVKICLVHTQFKGALDVLELSLSAIAAHRLLRNGRHMYKNVAIFVYLQARLRRSRIETTFEARSESVIWSISASFSAGTDASTDQSFTSRWTPIQTMDFDSFAFANARRTPRMTKHAMNLNQSFLMQSAVPFNASRGSFT